MTEPTKEEIERVAREVHQSNCIGLDCDRLPNGHEYRIAQWHLKKLEEQKAKYENVVDSLKKLISRYGYNPDGSEKDWSDYQDARKSISELESK